MAQPSSAPHTPVPTGPTRPRRYDRVPTASPLRRLRPCLSPSGICCRLAPVTRVRRQDDVPPVEAQFFYSSIIPIDDPLSTSSMVGSDAKASRGQVRPFARGDNNALEKAWLSLMSETDRRAHQDAWKDQRRPPQFDAKKLASLVRDITSKHWERHRAGYQVQDMAAPAGILLPTTPVPACCSDLVLDVTEELEMTFCSLIRRWNPAVSVNEVTQQVVLALGRLKQQATNVTEPRPSSADRASSRPGTASTTNASHPITRLSKTTAEPRSAKRRSTIGEANTRTSPLSPSQLKTQTPRSQTPVGSPALTRLPLLDDGISGKPFVRVGSPETQSEPSSVTLPQAGGILRDIGHSPEQVEAATELDDARQTTNRGDKSAETDHRPSVAEVAVGVSRLHMVSLPMLEMKPIYWSPVNDVAVVARATWFYRDTMLPIPPAVANQLEAGYQELRPWTETWSDELRCAIDVGPLGEEKVSHRLWPKESEIGSADDAGFPEPAIPTDPFCAARCFRGEAAAEGTINAISADKRSSGDFQTPVRPFSNYHVIYKNTSEAFLMKPSLKPSAYYGRRPVLKIMKGVTVGVPVVRGFDRAAWEHLHHKKHTPDKPGASAADESHESSGQDVCSACRADKERGQVTDLILVAHGIGQKFAERVESFHFTHAISGFRRAVNIELQSPIVKQVLREDHNGLMILPLNWRTGLSFEDGGPMREEDKAENIPEGFGLKDIEPDTIPAVRSIISDVMFDIPFYMSHHKGKMIKALVFEANRVYRLWCRNNPGFAERGRIHLIGHSLGSAMALEVLSHQPTTVPRLDLTRKEPETRFFEFDTKNLFLAGSPAGFFLLLERGTLMPRHGRMKPGADSSDIVAKDVVGEAGTFGCLAVDNIYNILAKEDPIAYLLTGAVDPNYAASLKTAYVPSIAGSLWKSVGAAMRNVVPGMAPAPNPLAPEPERPSTIRLPSQLELEVHDFTREEIAEKKAFLLNDNGQIDWYLRSGGGPLEIQYLNMLSAHSSYWTNHDFIRMLCIEVGRKPGRAHTLPALRAAKAAKRLLVN
ncbi:phosphatidic acid-preferring phospholipase A1 [Fusarium albosuccineum]|uniref:Phosphatidic acid-preferring phospholipase A1 n=1 Tax=Fusarium albosuccineum TaxID=1237068 RepID=A0A8H4L5U4_9HYPO|nr:phosphatidic acid-preferring phospholipase A1 [Fusarium albosuccineum]